MSDLRVHFGPFAGGLSREFKAEELAQVLLLVLVAMFLVCPWTGDTALPVVFAAVLWALSQLLPFLPSPEPPILILDSWGIYWNRRRRRQRIKWADIAQIRLVKKPAGNEGPESMLLRLYNAKGKKCMQINLNDLDRCGKALLLVLEERLEKLYEQKAAPYLDGKAYWSLRGKDEMMRIESDGLRIEHPRKGHQKILWSDLERIEWVPGRLDYENPHIGTHLAIKCGDRIISIDKFDHNIHILIYILRNLSDTREKFEPFPFHDDQIALERAYVRLCKTLLPLIVNAGLGMFGLFGIIMNVFFICRELEGRLFCIARIVACCLLAVWAGGKVRRILEHRTAIKLYLDELQRKLRH